VAVQLELLPGEERRWAGPWWDQVAAGPASMLTEWWEVRFPWRLYYGSAVDRSTQQLMPPKTTRILKMRASLWCSNIHSGDFSSLHLEGRLGEKGNTMGDNSQRPR